MASVNIYLREQLAAVSAKNIAIAPGIDDKKLNNAVKAFGYSDNPANVVALFDNTLFGSGKDGLLFTGEQLIYRASFSDPVAISFAAIASVQRVETWVGSKKDKLEQSLLVVREDGSQVVIKDLLDCNYEVLATVLQGVVSDFDDFQEEKQLIPIDEMQEAVKVAYVKAIINMAYDNDAVIDEKEFAEILLLMTRLNLSSESRLSLRAYMTASGEVTPLEDLLSLIDSQCPAGQIKSVHISLTKDLINLFFCTGGTSIEQFAFLQKYRGLLQVTDGEIDLAVAAIVHDHNMLKDDVTDDQFAKAMKVLSAKAAAVGTPLAAVYLSGSVVGMSAAGLTSGLATLGMGGMLGLSSMATGIGVAVLIGVGAYTGIRKLTGANELTRSKRRELMLNEVIKQTQATISLLIEDINYITVRLNQAITAHGDQDAQIKKLMSHLSQMTSAGTVLNNKASATQSSATKLRCAPFLDEGKLRVLTAEPTKAELFAFIRGFYEERAFTLEKDGQKTEVTKLAVKPGASLQELENLAKAFEAIGYFNVGDVLKSTAADVAGKAKDKLTGLFS
ncbi:hypothetical protein D3C77_287030 [compost metagenome]|uniref:hypothetical protein n=1 Tax=unclassified Pseudomonas TaxID=196821 RepID=UPI0005EB343A|nr:MULTISPECIES: hypothetical protein [unclassified Pseudomonas]KJK07770.1 hypothetical protein UB47_10040 [Pseudomonas sp. 5]QYX48211.1 hypothetical protein K3F43_01440 [Pseudomonas sp. S11A 273]